MKLITTRSIGLILLKNVLKKKDGKYELLNENVFEEEEFVYVKKKFYFKIVGNKVVKDKEEIISSETISENSKGENQIESENKYFF